MGPILVHKIDADGIGSILPIRIGMRYIPVVEVFFWICAITPMDNVLCHAVITRIGHSPQIQRVEGTFSNRCVSDEIDRWRHVPDGHEGARTGCSSIVVSDRCCDGVVTGYRAIHVVRVLIAGGKRAGIRVHVCQ
ncbi:hypothetical protein ES703_120902 [subsurface metagenome]